MSTLTLSPQIYQRLQKQAERAGRPPESVAEELLAAQLALLTDEQSQLDDVIQTLYAKGELVAMSPGLARWTEDLRRSLGTDAELQELQHEREDLALNPPLSQVILDMRGPKP